MPKTVQLAFEGESEMKRRIAGANRRTTKLAYAPSSRQRALTSTKAERISGRDELLYKGEDLKRRPR